MSNGNALGLLCPRLFGAIEAARAEEVGASGFRKISKKTNKQTFKNKLKIIIQNYVLVLILVQSDAKEIRQTDRLHANVQLVVVVVEHHEFHLQHLKVQFQIRIRRLKHKNTETNKPSTGFVLSRPSLSPKIAAKISGASLSLA